MKKINLLLIALLFTGSLFSKGIDFHTDILEEALEMAKAESKYIFIDTYAPWCGPCKRMNKVFTDPRVGKFFNEKFINVKINMDGHLGKDMLVKYEVVWLPTLLILDAEGNVKYRVDKEICADDLIKMANNALDPNYYFYDSPVFSKSPIVPSKTNSITTKASKKEIAVAKTTPPEIPLGVKDIPDQPEKILYVFNENASSNNPEILYHEAYLMMQLMDPKKFEIADKYLATQTDWASEKNIKFIFDFIESTNSKYFNYFASNLPLFENYLGKEKVRQNLELMIYMKLNNGFPRPNLEESINLHRLIDSEAGESKAYLYYLQRLKMEENSSGFIEVAEKYVSDINPYNHAVIQELVSLKLVKNQRDFDHSMEMIEKGLMMDSRNVNLLLLKAKLHYRMKDLDKAQLVISDAIRFALNRNQDISELSRFQARIALDQAN